ncbi:conserved hypothetical protein [delta proteobacterium NaphS2]|nr:conserved hypothetical protein [delta proteobacterium NaphS2]
MKKVMVMALMFFVASFVVSVHAEEYVIKDYTFTWHIIKYGGTTMEIQKTPAALVVIFGQPTIPLCALTISPEQANAVGELLNKTEDYYQIQRESEDVSSSDTLFSHNCEVNFSSKQGRDFKVRVKQDKIFGSVVLMTKDEAVEVGKYLRQAEQMAAFVDKRIRP